MTSRYVRAQARRTTNWRFQTTICVQLLIFQVWFQMYIIYCTKTCSRQSICRRCYDAPEHLYFTMQKIQACAHFCLWRSIELLSTHCFFDMHEFVDYMHVTLCLLCFAYLINGQSPTTSTIALINMSKNCTCNLSCVITTSTRATTHMRGSAVPQNYTQWLQWLWAPLCIVSLKNAKRFGNSA